MILKYPDSVPVVFNHNASKLTFTVSVDGEHKEAWKEIAAKFGGRYHEFSNSFFIEKKLRREVLIELDKIFGTTMLSQWDELQLMKEKVWADKGQLGRWTQMKKRSAAHRQ